MTELRKKAIDTCNKALEVLIAAYAVVETQMINATGEEYEALMQQRRKIARTGATVDTVLAWAGNEMAKEGLVKMGFDILTQEMKELGFDMEGTKK